MEDLKYDVALACQQLGVTTAPFALIVKCRSNWSKDHLCFSLDNRDPLIRVCATDDNNPLSRSWTLVLSLGELLAVKTFEVGTWHGTFSGMYGIVTGEDCQWFGLPRLVFQPSELKRKAWAALWCFQRELATLLPKFSMDLIQEITDYLLMDMHVNEGKIEWKRFNFS